MTLGPIIEQTIITDNYYTSPLSQICAAINEDRRFIDGVIEVCKLYLGSIMNMQLEREINSSINVFIHAYFSQYKHPGWVACCDFSLMSHSLIPRFKTLCGETISLEEAQYRVDKFGWTLRFYEEEKVNRWHK